jgi:hypothetical protein
MTICLSLTVFADGHEQHLRNLIRLIMRDVLAFQHLYRGQRDPEHYKATIVFMSLTAAVTRIAFAYGATNCDLKP